MSVAVLPEAFEWHDVKFPEEFKDVYLLLRDNYIEGKDVSIRDSEDFLRWALMPPGFFAHLYLGVRARQNKKLCAFITALPMTIHQKTILPPKDDKEKEDNKEKEAPAPSYTSKKTAFINFLCVHKKLRSKRLAPLLITEIVRRLYATVPQTGFQQVIYTVGKDITRMDSYPFGKHVWHHRFLDIKTLVEAKFCTMPKKLTLNLLNKLPESPNLVELEEAHLPRIVSTLRSMLSHFPLRVDFSLEEARHQFLPRKDVVYSFVRHSPTSSSPPSPSTNTSELSMEFISFYNQEMCLHGQKVRAAVCYYYACLDVKSLASLFLDALSMAKKLGFHVFNCLDNFHNKTFFQELKFKEGSGKLNFYLGPFTQTPLENVALSVF